MPPIDDAAPDITDLVGLLAPEDDNKNGADDGGENEQTAQPDGDDGDDGNPDEGTDAEGDEGEGEDPAGEESDDEPSTEPSYTVKVDGKDVRVTLKEALAGYQRQQDYSRKTEEVANARKAAEAETATARQQREQYGAVLKLIQDKLGPADQEPTVEQWNSLRQADPGRYAAEWADYQRRDAQRNAVRTEQQRVVELQRQENLGKAAQFLDGERQKLTAALPALADKEKGPAELKAIREYAAKTFGYSEAEMDQAYDHRMIIAIDKARKWDNHAASLKAAKSKVTAAPALPAPGPRVPGKSPKAAARAIAQKQFDRSGRVDDAVTLLLG